MALPKWITPSGFLSTVTERTFTSIPLQTADMSTFSLISGDLPGGLRLSNTGTISGIPFSVGEKLRSQFVIRALNADGITDRTFIIDTDGPTDPTWLTPAGFLTLGLGGQPYVVNKSYVDYQLSAIYDVLPAGQELRYYIGDREGELPPGLSLSESGRITGYITDTLAIASPITVIGTGTTSISGGFDTETYDYFPYDYLYREISTSTVTTSTTYIRPKFLSKTYQFYATVTDGVADAKRQFLIKVEDPSAFRADTTLIDVDTAYYTADASYLITPTWLSPVNLGYVRTSNNQVIQLKIYDPDPNTGPTTYDWLTPTVNIDGTENERDKLKKLGFDLDPATGALFAKLPYQPAYSTPFKFTVRLIKTDVESSESSYRDRTFTLTVKGNIENTLEFTTPPNIGTINPGYISELAVVAAHTSNPTPVRYRLVSGSLPAGLSLATDGTIIGSVSYNSQTTFDLEDYGFNSFVLDNNLTTVDKIYKFTVEASDIYSQSLAQQEFYITVDQLDVKEYVKMHIKPYMSSSERTDYANFITDPTIFERNLLYRPLDPEFGVQADMKFVLEYGIEKPLLRVFAASLNSFFREHRFLFNGVKTAISKDTSGNPVYEVIYVELVDDLGNGIDQMKGYLDSNFLTDEYTMPNWMRSVQSSYGAPIGFVKAIPLCYCLPGTSSTILKRINLSKFDFKLLDFTADRLLISSTTDYPETKYLLFPRRYAGGTTVDEDLLLFVPEGAPLLTQDGTPLLDLEQ